MTTRPPAEIGMTLDEVDTPALIVDLDALEDNLDRMAAFCAASNVKLPTCRRADGVLVNVASKGRIAASD